MNIGKISIGFLNTCTCTFVTNYRDSKTIFGDNDFGFLVIFYNFLLGIVLGTF